MKYLCVRKWDEHQHYKDRDPAWIKVYNRLLDDFDFLALSEVAQAQLLKLWLLASRTDNRIPYDLPYITAKIGARTAIDIDDLIVHGWLQFCDANAPSERVVSARKVASRKKKDRERKRTIRAEASASMSDSSLRLEERREEKRREELTTTSKKLPKYPHFSREMCDRLLSAWWALGRPSYSEFRGAFGPLFPEQPPYTVEQVERAIAAAIEDAKAGGTTQFLTLRTFIGRLGYWVDFTTPIAKRDPAPPGTPNLSNTITAL